MKSADFIIIGGGIVGLTIALEIRKEFGNVAVTVVEKEPRLGMHASGRNSGVIHAGFYYSADSLKAKFTRAGNIALTQYCQSRGLPLNPCGKLVVAQSAADLPQLDELLRRAERNAVPLESVTAEEARTIEPRVKTCERALFSPTTASADPQRVMQSLQHDASEARIVIEHSAGYVKRDDGAIATTRGRIAAGHVINCAGLYADKIARDFGFSERYRILPFKGLYLYSNQPPGAFRTHIYPVPDLRNPFLGVHFTVTTDGHTKIGPTAIPALWREQYRRFDNFNLGEFFEVLFREASLMVRAEFEFRRLAAEELQKYYRPHLVHLASRLADDVRVQDYTRWGAPGIRAQLLDVKARKLEMDFVVEGDQKSTHVLNAVSPGWTCAIPFATYVVDQLKTAIASRR